MEFDKNAESWKGIQRTACEVFSRVCGYLRPVNRWNNGKKEEFKNRVNYRLKAER